jgi:hypothetical protein
MQSKAKTVDEYLAALPEDRRAALQAVREVILANLSPGYEEGMQYGMIGYYVPHSVFPSGYHCDPSQPLPFAGIASQKNHMSFHCMYVYGDEAFGAWFREAWVKAGKKLDMGKACVRFKKLEDVPLKVIGQTIKKVPAKKYIAFYEKAWDSRNATLAEKKAASKAKSAKKQPAKARAKSSTKAAGRLAGGKAPKRSVK